MSFYVAQVSQQLSPTDSTSHDNEIVILRSKNGVQQGEELHAAFEKEKKEQRSNRIGIFESLCLWEMQNMCPTEWKRLAVRSTTHKSALCSVTISSFLILIHVLYRKNYN